MTMENEHFQEEYRRSNSSGGHNSRALPSDFQTKHAEEQQAHQTHRRRKARVNST
jgi:hypothetical protein